MKNHNQIILKKKTQACCVKNIISLKFTVLVIFFFCSICSLGTQEVGGGEEQETNYFYKIRIKYIVVYCIIAFNERIH